MFSNVDFPLNQPSKGGKSARFAVLQAVLRRFLPGGRRQGQDPEGVVHSDGPPLDATPARWEPAGYQTDVG